MSVESKNNIKNMQAMKEAILAQNDIDPAPAPALYAIYWFKGAKHLKSLEREISKLDPEILKMELENAVSLNWKSVRYVYANHWNIN